MNAINSTKGQARNNTLTRLGQRGYRKWYVYECCDLGQVNFMYFMYFSVSPSAKWRLR